MDTSLEIRLAQNNDEYQVILDIRHTIFVKEQNIPIESEYDGLDKDAMHILVKLEEKLIGCARIRIFEKRFKLERIAILKEFRHNGFGTRLMKYLIQFSKESHAIEISIHAQYYLKTFYEELGFKQRGEAFFEVGIKHIEMYLTLNVK